MSIKRDRQTITVGELKRHLAIFAETDELFFGGLEFYRTKSRGPGLVQVEFAQNVCIDDGRWSLLITLNKKVIANLTNQVFVNRNNKRKIAG